MFPVGSFGRMEIELSHRERARGTDIPITVGILIADCRNPDQRSQIFNNLPDFNNQSNVKIDFYIPGYCPSEMRRNDILKYSNEPCYYDYNHRFYFNGKTYLFSEKDYWGFINALRARGIEHTYQPRLILLPYVNDNLKFSDAIIFDLERERQNGAIDSFGQFFNEIFQIAGYTTACNEFGEVISRRRLRKSISKFIIDKLKDAPWDILQGYLSN